MVPAERCDLCASGIADNTLVFASGNLQLGDTGATVHTEMCMTCKFVFQRELLSETLLTRLYTRDRGFQFNSPDQDQDRVVRYKAWRQGFVSDALGHLGPAGSRRLKVLDIGGGTGDCTEHLADNHDVWLLDIHQQAPLHTRMRRISGLFEHAVFVQEFDVIVMNHVLEHVFSPTRFLRKAYDS